MPIVFGQLGHPEKVRQWLVDMTLRSLVLVAFVLIGVVGCGGGAPLRNGRIVFAHKMGGNTRSAQHLVETVLPTGKSRSVLPVPIPEERSRGGAAMMMPRWSPDGKRLSVVSHRSLYIVDADGGNALWISPFTESYPDAKDFAWSPDGQRLAFVDNGFLRVVSVDGQRGVLIAENSTGRVYNVPMGWSADGQELFFYEHGVRGKFRLYGVKLASQDFGDWPKVMRPSRSKEKPRSAGLPRDRWRLLATWSTGRYDSCRMNRAQQQLACFLRGQSRNDSPSSVPWSHVAVVSTDQGKVSAFLPETVDELPKWSPNGEIAAFSANDGLWTVRSDGWGHPVRVSETAQDFAWSPDGKWLVVAPKDRKSGIFKVRSNGKDRQHLVEPGGVVRSLAWQAIPRKK
ncbi:PD40 domain-containing protein [filamentous cyanobacterium LEGE 11480]|uniref:PD40 domain-containing protein n=1 Tax=Romeriopsis navalis LEGE 11480 TaxID=2777977 RepID=A0A928VT63_9CYAN|nr:hypothetical protein [Romeriopsis navalis]MBE9032092.1 PD40 domain-containing protein [Romeriopsis navalis LEGE 11480]